MSVQTVLSSNGQWLTYHILQNYGTDENNLTQNTSSKHSGDDIDINNMNYSVELNDLY